MKNLLLGLLLCAPSSILYLRVCIRIKKTHEFVLAPILVYSYTCGSYSRSSHDLKVRCYRKNK